MRQRSYGRDRELTFRISFTMFLLALVYVAFIGLLFRAGIEPVFIFIVALLMVLFQYFGSDPDCAGDDRCQDRHARAGAGPARHGGAAGGDGRHAETQEGGGHGDSRPQRVCHRPQSQERRNRRHQRASVAPRPARARGRAGARAHTRKEPRRDGDYVGEHYRHRVRLHDADDVLDEPVRRVRRRGPRPPGEEAARPRS